MCIFPLFIVLCDYNPPTLHTDKCNMLCFIKTRSIRKMLGPFTTASHLTPIHQMSLAVLSRAACASMSTTTPTTTTTTRDRGDRYGPMEWAQSINHCEHIGLHVLRQPQNRKYITYRTSQRHHRSNRAMVTVI